MRKYKFQFKLLLTNVLVIGVIITAFLVSFFLYYMDIRSQKDVENRERILQRNCSSIENSLDMLDSIALQLSANNYISEVLKNLDDENGENYFQSEVIETQRIHEFMWSYILKPNVASRVCIYNDQGDFVYTGDALSNAGIKKYLAPSRLKEMQTNFAQEGVNRLCTVSLKETTNDNEAGYISIVREIKGQPLLNEKPLGYVEVQLFLDVLKRQILPVSEYENVYVKLTEDGRIISASGQNKDYIPENGRYTHTEMQIDKYGLSVEMVQDNSPQHIFVRTMVFSILAIILVLVAGVYIIQRTILMRLTKPLIELCNSITEIQDGLMDEEAMWGGRFDEFKHLNTAFNRMLGNLRQSMDEVVLAKTSEINAQMIALQAQMNPHFIHNTIAMIGALADDGENEKAVVMCGNLSQMIRYNTEIADIWTDVGKELQHARYYLELMKARYEEKFSYEVDMQMAEGIQIPKFVLQPLVENCIRHGFQKKEFPWNIYIRCFEEEGKWYLSVKDNGIGISEEQVSEIHSRLVMIQSQGPEEILKSLKIGGLSLTNVMVRLWMSYGEDMYFEVCTPGIENQGMHICIGGRIND